MHITSLIDTLTLSTLTAPSPAGGLVFWGKASDLAQKCAVAINLASPLCLPGFKLNRAHALRFSITGLAREAGLCVITAWLKEGADRAKCSVSIVPHGGLTTAALRNPLERKRNVNGGAALCPGGPGGQNKCGLDPDKHRLSTQAVRPHSPRPPLPSRPQVPPQVKGGVSGMQLWRPRSPQLVYRSPRS